MNIFSQQYASVAEGLYYLSWKLISYELSYELQMHGDMYDMIYQSVSNHYSILLLIRPNCCAGITLCKQQY